MKLFTKTLTATDCLKRLSIPKRLLTSLPEFHGGHAVELQVRCETREWPIVCTIRKKGYKKPVLSKGWRKFVVGNSLNVSDELTLHKEEDESGSLHFRVEVKRASSRSKSCVNVEEKRENVVNCTDIQTSSGIISCSTPLRQFGFSMDDVASPATNETNNSLFKHFAVEEQEIREFKLFGAIIGGALVVGTSETVHHKAYHNSVKEFGLSTGSAELGNSTLDGLFKQCNHT